MCSVTNSRCFGSSELFVCLILVSCDWKTDPVHCNGQFILLRVSHP